MEPAEGHTGADRHAMVGPAKKVDLEPALHLPEVARPDQGVAVGCGTLRGGIPLIDYLAPGHYAGVEVRGDVLDEGRRELAENGLGHVHPRTSAAEQARQRMLKATRPGGG